MADTIESVDVAGVHGIVAVNPDGTAIGTPVGGATSANQTNGTQKTQIVDAGGEVVTVTGGKLDVNATASLAGESIPIAGATTAVGVAIVDGSGNQITSFGGGTQYTEGDTDASLTGTVAMVEGAANAVAAMTQPLTDTQLRATAVPISAAALPLPTGASTAANQTTIIGHVDGIETLLGTIDTDTGNIATEVAGLLTDTELRATPVPVSGTVGVTGVSTLAEQQTQTTALGTLLTSSNFAAAFGTAGTADTQVLSIQGIASMTPVVVDLGANNAVTITSGAITETNSTAILADTANIDTATAAINAKMVSGTDIGDVTINNASGASAVNIQDGGNSITVDASQLDIDNLNPTDDIVAIGDGTSTATVRNLAANDALNVAIVDGSGDQITSFGGGTQYTEDAASAANPVGTASILVRTDTPATQTTTDGDNIAQRGTNYGAAYVQLVTSSGAYIDSVGGGTEYTEDVATANPIVGKAIMVERDDALTTVTPVEGDNIGLRGTAEGALWTQDFNSDAILSDTTAIKTAVEIIDNAISGNEMQVDVLTMPTTTVQATNLDIRDLTFAADKVDASGTVLGAGTNNIGDVDVLSSALPTGASTLAEQQTQTTHLSTIAGDTTSIQTSVELIDDTVATLGTTTYTEAATKGLIIGAVRRDADTTLVDTTNEVGPVQMNAAGQLKVEVFSGETLPVSMASTTVTGTVAVTQSGTWDEVGINDSGNSITVDNGGTFAVQSTNQANSGVDIGDVTINNASGASAVNIQDGGNTITVDGTVAVTGVSTLAEQQTQTTALQLIDDSIYADDADWTADTSKHLLTGGVTQTTPTANTDGDTTPLITNNLRELRVAAMETDLAAAGTSHVKKYYTNAGAVTDGIIWSPAAGKRWYLTHLSLNVSAACTVTIEDDLAGGDSAVYKAEFAANSGVVLTFPDSPMFSGEDAADLLITTTAGNVYVTAVGYEI